MTGSEFLRKIRKLGNENGLTVRCDQQRGKGSHATLYYGDHFTVIHSLKDELQTGIYCAMLKQLGICEEDLR